MLRFLQIILSGLCFGIICFDDVVNACSTSGAEDDWESLHSLLCTGERSDPAHREALLKFNKHANVAMSIKIGTVDFRDDIVIWARKKTGSSVIRINSKKEAEEFLTKYHTFVIGRFDKFEGHEYDEFVRAAKLDNEPEIYTTYDGAFTTSKILEFLDYNNFPLVYMSTNNMDAARDILVDGIKNLPQNKQLLEVVILELIQLHIAILTISLSIVTINNISLCLTLLFPFILSNLVIDSLQNCKDTLAMCQNELEAAKSEIQSWHSSIQNEPCVPAGATPEPKMLLDYLQALKSSEESLREQLLKAKKKEAAFIVTFAKREQEIAELKVSCSK
ncbi:hypothetical protein Ahy_B03g061930 [Arachis hypogaea]|uniref:Uncharacterized protein n=1 Tax=Arachis hypogaea TaxID=3818 RepID=A0A444ZSI0_ARAHY|nr:hypothetical protein Ahy_B03g061930 [Arachis hypogaea]